MTYTIVHRMGRLVPWRFYLWHNKFALLVLIFRLFLRMGIRILNVKSKVMSYFKYPNGTAGGRFTGYAASWWHNSFNLHHFRPCFSSLIMTWNCPYFSTISALVISVKVFPCSLVAVCLLFLYRLIWYKAFYLPGNAWWCLPNHHTQLNNNFHHPMIKPRDLPHIMRHHAEAPSSYRHSTGNIERIFLNSLLLLCGSCRHLINA